MPKIDHQKPSKPNPSPSLPFNHPSPQKQEVRNTLKSRTQRSPTRPKQVQTKQELNVPASKTSTCQNFTRSSLNITLLQNKTFNFHTDWISLTFRGPLSLSIFPRKKKKKKKNQFSDEPNFPGKSLAIYNTLFCISLSLSIMAAIASLSFSAVSQCSERKATVPSARTLASNSEAFRSRTNFSCHFVGVRFSVSTFRMVIHCMSVSTGYFLYSAWLLRKIE